MIEYIILKDVCKKQDPDLLLNLEEAWFFDPTAKNIYKTIKNHFHSYSRVPSIQELEIIYGSNPFVDTPDVNISEFIIQKLKDRYVKTTFFNHLYDTIDKYGEDASAEEILDDITNLTIELRELAETKDEVFNAEEEIETEVLNRKPIGLGQFDAVNGGLAPGELMLLGGYRGTGKSFLSLNTAVFNYQVNKETVAVVSIEMPYRDYKARLYGIISGLPVIKIAKDNLTDLERKQLWRAKAQFFKDKNSPEYIDFIRMLEEEQFDYLKVVNSYSNIPSNKHKFFIIDSPDTTIGKLFYYANKLKHQYGLKYLVVDYLNIIKEPNTNNDPLDWKAQINKTNELKSIARNLNIKILAPFQTTEEGKVRYAKGIEDPVDFSLIFNKTDPESNVLSLHTSKVRNGTPIKFSLIYDKQSLRVKPATEKSVAEGDIDEAS